MAKNKEPSQRQLRVGEEMRHILADVFMRGDFHDELLRNVSVTVTEVDVAPDMRNATAYVSLLGGAPQVKEVLEMLNERVGEFNKEVAKKLSMKFSPRLKFSGDNRFEYAEKIHALLSKVNKE